MSAKNILNTCVTEYNKVRKKSPKFLTQKPRCHEHYRSMVITNLIWSQIARVQIYLSMETKLSTQTANFRYLQDILLEPGNNPKWKRGRTYNLKIKTCQLLYPCGPLAPALNPNLQHQNHFSLSQKSLPPGSAYLPIKPSALMTPYYSPRTKVTWNMPKRIP